MLITMAKNILIVDDDPTVSSIFEFILQQVGYSALSATNGEDCLKIVEKTPSLNLVFLDAKMPGLSGIETLKRLQKSTPNLRVIMMSNYTESSKLEDVYDLGAFGIIYKPFDVEEVLTIIKRIFKIQV